MIEFEEEIGEAFYEYFTNLFTTTSPSRDAIERTSQSIRPKVTSAIIDHLLRWFTKKEVHEAVQQMGPMKSLGAEYSSW